MEYVRAMEASLAPGDHTTVEARGWDLLVVNVDGDYLVVENRCTHAKAELSKGRLDGSEITCAEHGARFDLRSGACTGPPATQSVPKFDARVKDGFVEVKIDKIKVARRPQFGPMN
ncbi:MAG: Rieske 2Fe-2S domain-containing protein [Pseudomonadales bacterium]|jgi:nitrite reductase/ring-hydroxylating ferredoxin subunit